MGHVEDLDGTFEAVLIALDRELEDELGRQM